MFEGVRTTEILVLDDLGTESATPWAQEKLFQIINYRYNFQFPTVFTTVDLRRLTSGFGRAWATGYLSAPG